MDKISKSLLIILLISIGAVVYLNYGNFLGHRQTDNSLKIGLITDVAGYGKEVDGKWEINWRSQGAISRFINRMNKRFKPDITLELGDFTDGKDKNSIKDWRIMNKQFAKLKMPFYHVLGNHEVRKFTKKDWLDLTGYGQTYYYKDIKNYRLVIVDANFLEDQTDAEPGKSTYPGHINDKEWQWLENTLKDAVRQNKDTIVFMHQPPVNTDLFTNWVVFPQGEKLHKLFSEYKVRAVFSGHIEALCSMQDGPTKYFVLNGVWKENRFLKPEYRFKEGGNFYYVTITPDDINIAMEYRVFKKKTKKNKKRRGERIKGWKKIVVSSDKYNCQDGKDLKYKNASQSVGQNGFKNVEGE